MLGRDKVLFCQHFGSIHDLHCLHSHLSMLQPYAPTSVKKCGHGRGQRQALISTLALQEVPGDPKTALGQGVKMLKGGGGIFKSAAVTVLRQDRRLLTTAEITK